LKEINFILKIILLPFSLLYGLGVSIRNVFYDTGILKASKFSIPIISVGNLSIGGAGKTPHIEYLIELLRPYINLGTMSRGYKRKTKGYLDVRPNHNALEAGDEPLQFKLKYPDIAVAVAESRAIGIPYMVADHPDIQLILLDDAFQHRSVRPDLNILLTQFEKPYTRDQLLPMGRLRETPIAAERADIIIVTKCPEYLSESQRESMQTEINPLNHQKVYFTKYEYQDIYSIYNPNSTLKITKSLNVILLSAIANTDYLFDYLENQVHDIKEIEYEDHHVFTRNDVEYIEKVYKNWEVENLIILTTEKDAIRLAMFKEQLGEKQLPIFVLPIKVSFLDDEKNNFDHQIKEFLLNYQS